MSGKRLKTARAKTGMTQEVIANKIGMKQQHYARFETGERELPREKLITIAKLLNVSTDYLLGLTDEMNPYPPAKED